MDWQNSFPNFHNCRMANHTCPEQSRTGLLGLASLASLASFASRIRNSLESLAFLACLAYFQQRHSIHTHYHSPCCCRRLRCFQWCSPDFPRWTSGTFVEMPWPWHLRGKSFFTRNLRRSWNQPKWQQFHEAMKPWSWTTTKRCTALLSNQCEFSDAACHIPIPSIWKEPSQEDAQSLPAYIAVRVGTLPTLRRSCKVGWSWLDSLTQPTDAKRITPPKFEHSHSSYLKNDDYQIWKSLFQGSAFQETQSLQQN